MLCVPAGDQRWDHIQDISDVSAFELEAIATDYDEDSDVLLGQIATRLKMSAEFERAAESFDD